MKALHFIIDCVMGVAFFATLIGLVLVAGFFMQ